MIKKATASPTGKTIFQELKFSLAGAIILAMVGLVPGVLSVLGHWEDIDTDEIAHLGLIQTQRDVVDLRDKIAQSEKSLPAFTALHDEGMIGSLGKTEHADRFEEIVSGHPAAVSSFSIGALQTMPESPGMMLTDLALGRHQLTFQAHPPHEVHLISLIHRIEQELGGLTLLNQCSLSGSGASSGKGEVKGQSETERLKEGLTAKCTFDTYLFDRQALSPPGADDPFGMQP